MGALILAIASVGSYILGLLRDRLLAGQFGAGPDLDVFNSAFIVPDFVMNLIAAAVTTAFVPVFASVLTKRGLAAAWHTTNQLLNLIGSTMLGVIVLVWLAFPMLSGLISPGFTPEQHELLISVTRLLLLSPFCFALSIVFGSALQSLERFVTYALSPLLYNVGIIIGIVWLAPRWGITGVIMGVVLGAMAHMLARGIELRRAGWSWQWTYSLTDPEIRHTLALMLPRVIALVAVQTNLWVYNSLASELESGSISVFNLARNFQSLPVSVFGISLATAAFPVFARLYAQAKPVDLGKQVQRSMLQVLFFTLPAGVGLMLVAHPLIALMLGGNQFTPAAVSATGLALAVFALSVPWESSQHVLARAFYGQHNMITPVIVTVIGSVVNGVVCWYASQWWGVRGLVLGFCITSVLQTVLLAGWLTTKLPHLLDRQFWKSLLKIGLASTLMCLVTWLTISQISGNIKQLLIGVSVGTMIYLISCKVLRVTELEGLTLFINTLQRRLTGKKL